VQLTQRTGLDKLFLSRNDFGCNWDWSRESQKIENISEMETHHYSLVGDFGGHQDKFSFMSINQDIYRFEQQVTEQDLERLMSKDNWKIGKFDVVALDLSTYNLPLSFHKAYCRDFVPIGKRCILYLVHQTLIVRLEFILSPSDLVGFEPYMMQATQKTAQRLLQYSEAP
jgi:hypothetical protein